MTELTICYTEIKQTYKSNTDTKSTQRTGLPSDGELVQGVSEGTGADHFDFGAGDLRNAGEEDAYYTIELVNATVASIRTPEVDTSGAYDQPILDFALTGDDGMF